jgi:hypothetical protein
LWIRAMLWRGEFTEFGVNKSFPSIDRARLKAGGDGAGSRNPIYLNRIAGLGVIISFKPTVYPRGDLKGGPGYEPSVPKRGIRPVSEWFGVRANRSNLINLRIGGCAREPGHAVCVPEKSAVAQGPL